MNRLAPITLFVGLGLLFVLANATYVVQQAQSAIVLQLGKPKRVIETPGLHLKAPFLENVVLFDQRILNLNMRDQEVLSTDQLRLVVDAFARFRIEDPQIAYQRVRSESGAADRLSIILESALRDELGSQTFNDMLTPERGASMQTILKKVDARARELGVKVVDVRIKRADLPTGQPLESAFERMRTERDQEARAIRADGIRQAEVIRATADSQAAKIYADSYNRDAQFYEFYRSLQAYRNSLRKEDTRLVISPRSEFLRAFESGGGR